MAPSLDRERVDAIVARHPRSPADPEAQDDLWHDLAREVLTPEVPFAEHWDLFRRVYGGRVAAAPPPLVWRPDAQKAKTSNIGRMMDAEGMDDYRAFHAWSASDRASFWEKAVGRLDVVFAEAPEVTLDVSDGGVEDPKWFRGASMNIVASCFAADPDAVAIISGVEGETGLTRTTYAELKALVDRVAAGLRAEGFREGDAIALYMPMTVACVAAYLGIIKAGCVAVSIADSFAEDEVRTRLEIGEAKAVVTVDAFTRAGRTFPLYDKVKQAGAARAIVVRSDAGNEVRLREGDLWWDGLLDHGEDPQASTGDPDRVTNVLFSSGTTGTPKAIPWTHLTPIKCAVDAHLHHDVRPGEVLAWPTNIGWMMGPWLIYAALLNRATLALHEGAPNTADFCRFVERAEVNMLGVVPALVRAWRANGATEGVDWSAVRLFSSTGEASNVEDYLWLMAQAHYEAPIIEYCGGTEIGGGHLTGTMVQPASPAVFTTPALGLDLVILDEAGRPVEEGAMGALYIVPPSIGLSQRLLNRDHHDEYYADTPKGPNGERLRRHGDAVMRLPGGYYRAQGRADDTMNLGGIKVSSLELERVMDGEEAVYQSAAVAVQPEGGGADRLVVFVVPDGDPGDPAALKRRLQERIGRHLNPLYRIHDVVFVDALPRTASNKIMRRELRRQYVPGRLSAK